MKELRQVRVSEGGSIEIPVVVGGRLLYHYTIDPVDIRKDMRQMWLNQLEVKRWFTPRLRAEFIEVYDKALKGEK